VIGIVCFAIGAAVDPQRAAAAYLVAYMASLAVVLGALAMVMIARVTAATWFVVLRRQAEQVVATLPVFALLFIPVLVAVHVLYPWAQPTNTLAPELRDAIHVKAAYLNVPFFIVRSVIYWLTWIVLGETLRHTSLAQDQHDAPTVERRLYVTSAVGLIAFSLTVSFAAFDWMMSLAPAWYSTIYGIYYFAGGMVGGLALLALLAARGRWRGELPEAVGAEHMHALAKLLLTFVLFWIYIGFAQLIVIWSAEIPAETTWYVARMRGSFGALGVVLLFGHFALPFCALVVRAVRRAVPAMALIGAWLLVMHYLDIYWVVMPDASRERGTGFWLDATAVVLIVGIAALAWAARRVAQPAMVVGDPHVTASLEYAPEFDEGHSI
jgi:hypothetical protein